MIVKALHGYWTYSIETLYRPGLWASDAETRTIVAQVRRIARHCFEHAIPHYQALAGTREELRDVVLSVATSRNGEQVGFSSAVLLDVPAVGHVLHLGLTCVHPLHRSRNLCHRLIRRNFAVQLLRGGAWSAHWISNISGQINGLAPPAESFDDVFPGHRTTGRPSRTHLAIALAISERYRQQVHVDPACLFDSSSFVFRRGNAGGPFHHEEEVGLHRDPLVNTFYLERMDPLAGDAMVQVGRGSVLGVVKHLLRR